MAQSHLPRRILKETQKLISDPPHGISATPIEGSLHYLNVTMLGPEFSCYEDGVFHLETFLPEHYPMAAPRVWFLTKIHRPNIDKLGRIHLDIFIWLGWSPALQIKVVLMGIQQLLQTPMPDHACVQNVGREWMRDEPKAKRTAMEWTQQFASWC